MSEKCNLIRMMIEAVNDGKDIESLMPYHWNGSTDDYEEMLMMYIKYGKNERRVAECKKKLRNLYESR